MGARCRASISPAAAPGRLSYVPLARRALALAAARFVFGSGPGASGAKVNLGPLQPIEDPRLLLALFLAGYFARRWELLRLRRRMFGIGRCRHG